MDFADVTDFANVLKDILEQLATKSIHAITMIAKLASTTLAVGVRNFLVAKIQLLENIVSPQKFHFYTNVQL